MNLKKSKNIGFDLDDVLLNFTDSMVAHLNIKYQKNLERKDLTTFYYMEDLLGLTDEETEKHLKDFISHESHIDIVPIDGALEVIKELSKSNNLFVITARSDSAKNPTLAWIDKHFPNMFQNIRFTNTYFSVGEKIKKSDVCKELSIDMFVDDSLDNAKDVAGAGIPVLLFDAPWNQSDNLHHLITRIYSWDDILKELN